MFPSYITAALLFILHWQVKFFVWSNPMWIDREISDFARSFQTRTKNKTLRLLLNIVIFIDNIVLWIMNFTCPDNRVTRLLGLTKVARFCGLTIPIRERSISMGFRIH